MGLLVWLPLNGNLNNNGLTKGTATITNSGATINNNGKIGKTYLFDANDDYISIDSEKLRNCFRGGDHPFSITMWLYNTKATGTRAVPFGDYGLTGTIQFNLELNSSAGNWNNDIRFYWAGTPDYRATGTSVISNTWIHIAIVYDGTKVEFYRNGILVNTRIGTLAEKNKTTGVFQIGRDNRTGETAFGGYINDFRVYDNVLSKKQIREISKALVAHYKLEGSGGNPNLLGKKDYWWGGNTANATLSNYVVTMTCASQWAGIVPGSNILGTGGNFVLSYKFKKIDGVLKTIGGHKGTDVVINKWTLDGIEQTVAYNSPLYVNDDTNVHEVAIYLTATAGGDVPVWIQPNRAKEDSITTEVWDLKIESGNEKTSWVPNVSDNLYNSYDKLLLTDVSGNGYNATKTGTLTFNSNSPRYSGSTTFTSGLINSPACGVLANSKDFSINGWFYRTGGATITYYASAENYNTSVDLEGSRYFVYGSNGTPYVGTWTSAANTWQMITLVHDSVAKTLSLYVNGNYVSQVATSGDIYANNTLNIGGRQGSANFAGSISDVRIYATPLSAEDILVLYKDGGMIDKKNGVYAYEFKEE